VCFFFFAVVWTYSPEDEIFAKAKFNLPHGGARAAAPRP
jgi:hypothetical protein